MQVNSGATVTLQSLTLTEGSVLLYFGANGGAILNQGTLTVTDCTLSNNEATGKGGPGGPGSGGAIYNSSGTLTVTNTTFSGNEATGGGGYNADTGGGGGPGSGGAIYNSSGMLTVTNTTFSGNEATGGTGGISTQPSGLPGGSGGPGSGGAIYNSSGTLTVTNATFSGNQAISGGSNGFGGGIYNASGTVNLKGTILATSTPDNCDGAAVTGSYSIADDGTCFTNGSNNNVVTSTGAIGLASGLANNGGPTQTIALTPGGTANATAFITAPCTDQSSPPRTLTTDQRGFPRPAPSHSNFCSAGAFEYNPPFFNGEVSQGNQLYYLQLANGFFGYYSYQYYPNLYHFWLGFEQVSDANDGLAGVFFYDYGLQAFLYTNPSDFPYFFDYASNSWLWYYAGTSRWFYDFGGRGLFFSPPG